MLLGSAWAQPQVPAVPGMQLERGHPNAGTINHPDSKKVARGGQQDRGSQGKEEEVGKVTGGCWTLGTGAGTRRGEAQMEGKILYKKERYKRKTSENGQG